MNHDDQRGERLTLAMHARDANAQRLAESLVKQYSPFRSMPARDAAGVVMLGYDRRIERDGISPVEADFMLANDLRRAFTQLRSLTFNLDTLSDARLAVIGNLVIVLGVDKVKAMGGLWGALARGDYEEAADQILLSDWPSHVGHTMEDRRRAVDLVAAMRTGSLRPKAVRPS